MTEIGKIQFLRELLAQDTAPDLMVRTVLDACLAGSEAGRIGQFGALMNETTAHACIPRLDEQTEGARNVGTSGTAT